MPAQKVNKLFSFRRLHQIVEAKIVSFEREEK